MRKRGINNGIKKQGHRKVDSSMVWDRYLWKKKADVKNATFDNIKSDMNSIFEKSNIKNDEK